MKRLLSLLAALGLSATAASTVIACGSDKSEIIVEKTDLSTIFNTRQVVVSASDDEDAIISKVLTINNVDQVVFAKNAIFNFIDRWTITISVLATSIEWTGADVQIQVSDDLNTFGLPPIIYPDQANFDDSPSTIAVIKANTTLDLDFDALILILDADRSVFIISPAAGTTKYQGVVEIGYSSTSRVTLQSLLTTTDLTTTKNATKADVLNQLSALNNNVVLDESQLIISDYNYQTDFTLTLTPTSDSSLYYGDSLTIVVRKNVADLGLNGFSYSLENDETKIINKFKQTQALLGVDWTALDIKRISTSSTLVVSANLTNNQKYSGSFTVVLWQPILFLDGYKATDNQTKVMTDLLKNNSAAVRNLKLGFDIDAENHQLNVYTQTNPAQNHISINYYERTNLADAITTTTLIGVHVGASDTEIKKAIIAQNKLTDRQIDAIWNQVDVMYRYSTSTNGYFYLVAKPYNYVSTVFYGGTADFALDVQN